MRFAKPHASAGPRTSPDARFSSRLTRSTVQDVPEGRRFVSSRMESASGLVAVARSARERGFTPPPSVDQVPAAGASPPPAAPPRGVVASGPRKIPVPSAGVGRTRARDRAGVRRAPSPRCRRRFGEAECFPRTPWGKGFRRPAAATRWGGPAAAGKALFPSPWQREPPGPRVLAHSVPWGSPAPPAGDLWARGAWLKPRSLLVAAGSLVRPLCGS